MKLLERETGFEPATPCLEGRNIVLKLVNNLPVSQLAELTNLSKAYISNVKNGKLPPSKKFLNALSEVVKQDNQKQPEYLSLFLKSREAMGCSSKTIEFYQDRLGQFGVNPYDWYRKGCISNPANLPNPKCPVSGVHSITIQTQT